MPVAFMHRKGSFQRCLRRPAASHTISALIVLAIVCFLPCSFCSIIPCKTKTAAQIIDSSRSMIDSGEFASSLQCLSRVFRPNMPDSVFFTAKSLQCEAHMGVGDSAAALDACMQAWHKDPSDPIVNLRLGNLHSNIGNHSGSLPFFHVAIQRRRDSPIPRNNLALALQALGRKDEAIQVFEDALVETDSAAHGRSLVLTNLAVALPDHLSDRKLDLLDEAYALDFLDETAINIANVMCSGSSNDKEKCEGCRVLLQHHISKFADRGTPLHQGIYRALALCLSKLGMGREATNVLQQSGSLTGEATLSAATYGSLDDVFHTANGRMDDLAAGIMTFGAALAKQSQLEQDPKKFIFHSIRACFTGLRINSGLATLRLRLDCAQRLFHAAAYRSAERMYTIALLRRYGPDRHTLLQHNINLAAEAYNGIGASIEMQHTRLDVAAFAYAQAVQLVPEYHTAFFSYAHIKVRLCDWRNRSGDFELMQRLIREHDASAVGPIFALHYPIEQLSVRKVAEDRSRSFVNILLAEDPDLFSPKFRALRPTVFTARSSNDELHIAFISADFNMRPVGKLVQSLPQLMNSYGSKISLWSLEFWDGSSVMTTITQGVAIAEMVKGWSPFRIASAINAAKVHVLVDLNGYTEGGGTSTCILRPAAVIVNFLGYPGTMGLPAYDIIVADRIVLPPELYPQNFFERVLIMPNTYMVCDHHQSYPMDALSQPPPWAYNHTHTLPGFSLHALLGAPHATSSPQSERVVLANFNHLQKLGPDSFAQWMRVMKAVPGSYLWLLKFPAEAEVHLHREAVSAGVDASRVVFLEKVTGDQHLQSKRLADVFVDTFEYNAHVSGLDALWAGLPLLTMAGDRMARRACSSFLVALGLPELIARTDDDYGLVLQRLVSQHTRHRFLLQFRKDIASRRETRPLFDTPLWALHFFKGLKLAYERALVVAAGHATNPFTRQKSGPGPFHLVVSDE